MAVKRIPRGTVGQTVSYAATVLGVSQAPTAVTAKVRLRQAGVLVEFDATVNVTHDSGTSTAAVALSWAAAQADDLDIALGGWRIGWKVQGSNFGPRYFPDPNDPTDPEDWLVITDC